MGFRKDGLYYMPNTSLKTDVRTVTKKPVQRIAAIFVKKFSEAKYLNMTYIAKGLTLDDAVLAPVFLEKVGKPSHAGPIVTPQT